MATQQQKKAAKKNIEKAQEKRKKMSRKELSASQPKGRNRKKPGEGGEGKFYRIEVRDSSQFETFRNQDVGKSGGLERVAGQRKSGSWATVAWLVSKDNAEVKNGTLHITNKKEREALKKQIPGKITHVKGDIFEARHRKNVPEKKKPTKAQKKARTKNIQKAAPTSKKKRASH